MSALASVDYFRLKVLLILEEAGAAVLRHTLRCGTQNNHAVDFDHYLKTLPTNSQANYTFLSPKDKKKQFNPSELKQIRQNPTWDDFDISLLYKCIILACENIARRDDPDELLKWKDPDVLEGLLTKIKDERNKIIHERPSMTEQEFKNKVDELKDVFLRTLREVQVRYNVPDPETKRLENETLSNIETIKRCLDFDYLWNIGSNKLLPDFKDTCRRHLKNIYQNVQFLDPLSFLGEHGDSPTRVPIQNIFSKLSIKAHDYKLDCREVLDLTQIPPSQCSPPPTQPGQLPPPPHYSPLATQPPAPIHAPPPPTQLLVVSGEAGSGKTTLLNFILSEWVEDRDKCIVTRLDKFDLVLRVICREWDAASLEEFVKRVLPEPFVFKSDIMSLITKCKILFLIDGLDEINEKSDLLVKDILSYCKVVQSFTIVCTSRPERVQDFLASVPEHCSKREALMQGVDPADRTEFVLKHYACLVAARAPDMSKDTELRDLMASIGWKEHFRLPLNLLFVATIFLDSPHLITNSRSQSSLYTDMHEWCVEKLQYRLATKVQIDRLTRERAVKRVLNMIYYVSLKGLLQDRLSLSEQDIDDVRLCCQEQALPSEEIMGAFFSLRKFVIRRVARATYCAPHKGLQEFFAAKYIVGQLQTGSDGKGIQGLLEDCLQKQPVNVKAQRNLLLHVVGLLSQPEGPTLPCAIEEAIDLLSKTGVERCDEWLSLLAETDANETAVSRVAHHVSGNRFGKGEKVVIADTTVFSAAALLPHVPCKEIVIDLKRDMHGLTEVVGALARQTLTQIFLHHHFKNPGQAAASGHILRCLPNRAQLTRFMGHLDDEHMKLLPRDLEVLYLVVATEEHARTLLPAIHQVCNNFTQLGDLGVHVPVSTVAPSSLTPLPFSRTPPTLVLSGVCASKVEAASQIAGNMCPREAGYGWILFPDTPLGVDGYKRLLTELTAENVKVLWGICVPDIVITEDERSQLHALSESSVGCAFLRYSEEPLWQWPV